MSVKIYQAEKKKRDEARAASASQARKNHRKLVTIPIGERRRLDEIQLQRVTPKPFDVRKSFRNGWDVVMVNPGKTIGLFGLGAVIFFGSYFLFLLVAVFGVAYGRRWLGVNVDPLWAFYTLTFFFTSFIGGLGFTIYAPMLLRLIRKQPVSLVLVLACYDLKLLFNVIKTSLLFSIFLMLCSLTLIGGVLFFVGASFCLVMVVDKNIVGMGAIRASFLVIKDHKADFGIFFLVTFLLNAPGMVFVVTFVVSVPITIIAFLTIYDSIVEPGNAYISLKESEVAAAIFS